MKLSTDRLRGMVWGAFLGDAAGLGTHWIYNLEDLREKYPEGVGGFEEPRPGHYHAGKEPGSFTHYGDASLLLLESIAEEGGFDAGLFGQRFVERMAPGVYDGYVDSATRGTVENYRDWTDRHPGEPYDFQNGADDDQLATATSLPALAVRYAGTANWLERVEDLARVRQNNGRAIAYARTQADLLGELLRERTCTAPCTGWRSGPGRTRTSVPSSSAASGTPSSGSISPWNGRPGNSGRPAP